MKFPLRVVSVERSLFEGDVEFIIATGAEGEVGVLARHAPLMTILKPGALRIKETIGGPEQTLFVGGGFLEVLPERVTVLADVAEHAEEISVAGAEEARRRGQEKNAALPEMATALLTSERVTLHNVPRVTDTTVMAEIVRELGGQSEGEGSVVLNTGAAVRSDVPDQLGRRMRATIVLLGALLARFGKARVPRPGGDDIGARRVEQHLRGLRQMGAPINETKDELVATAGRLRGA